MANLWELDNIYCYSQIQDMLEILEVKEELQRISNNEIKLKQQKEEQPKAPTNKRGRAR